MMTGNNGLVEHLRSNSGSLASVGTHGPVGVLRLLELLCKGGGPHTDNRSSATWCPTTYGIITHQEFRPTEESQHAPALRLS